MYVRVDLAASKLSAMAAAVNIASFISKTVIVSTYVEGSKDMVCYIGNGTTADLTTLRSRGYVLEETTKPE